MAAHDNSYKKIFSHAAMVEDLLTGFVKEEWVQALDFSTLEKVNGSYVSDDLRDRADDIVWRVRWGTDWLYVYLLLEFQSTNDPWMAVRIMTYIGLLYQDLISSKQLSVNASGRKQTAASCAASGFVQWRFCLDSSHKHQRSCAKNPWRPE